MVKKNMVTGHSGHVVWPAWGRDRDRVDGVGGKVLWVGRGGLQGRDIGPGTRIKCPFPFNKGREDPPGRRDRERTLRCPGAASTKFHKLEGSEQQKCLLSLLFLERNNKVVVNYEPGTMEENRLINIIIS